MGLAVAGSAFAATPTIRVSGTVTNGAGARVAAVGPMGRVAVAAVGANGGFSLKVPRAKAPSVGLMLIARDGGDGGPIILARSGSTGYVRLSAATRALGTIARGKGFATVTAAMPEGSFSKAGAVALKANGAPKVVPKVFAAVLRPKGKVTDTCANHYWVRDPADRDSGFELLDQLYKQVWGNASITDAQWDAITLPPTWLFWMKNSERQPLAKGSFLRSPECPADGQWSYKNLFGSEWLNLTNFKSLNQPVDEGGLLTVSVMWKYHQLNYAVGTRLHTLTSPDGKVYIEISRDPNRTSDTAPVPTGWTLSPEFTLTSPFTINLLGDAIQNYRLNNGDSYQGPMDAGF
ncbi:MAG: hypothetical protein EBU54_16985, partial [Mycobacteriaceae bacterium]|nr:hypothetical protein [Mycobacteriaceae bacterium]